MIATAEPATLCELATSEANPGWVAPVPVERIADPCESRRPTGEALEQAVRRRIAQRTWGRLRQLHVEVDAHRVIVRGTSPTYYLKQLALAAVQEALSATPVELDIQVAKSEPRLASGGNCRAGLLPQAPRPGSADSGPASAGRRTGKEDDGCTHQPGS
jgi:hypothetical protein